MVQCFPALFGSLDGDAEVVFDLLLPNELAQVAGTQLKLVGSIVFRQRGGYQAVSIQILLMRSSHLGDSKAKRRKRPELKKGTWVIPCYVWNQENFLEWSRDMNFNHREMLVRSARSSRLSHR